MQIKHVFSHPQSMSHDGSKILQSLQNNHLPLIDIIVRESLQNSLDASIQGVNRIDVKYKVDTFNSSELAPHFEEIDQKLIERYPGDQQFISFSDSNTYGLTGDYKSFDRNILNKSNFHKLVFGIGEHQDQEGAGGSWGYGKTSYFRIGVGLVIYYTRIKTDNGYEERLIGSMIEDPSKENRLLSRNDRGIAWWGQLEDNDHNRIFPITDGVLIDDILSIFNLKRYKGESTGTTIIIPYVQSRSKSMIDENAKLYPWEKNYEDEIKMAIQRWYFPRIMNSTYSKHLDNSQLYVEVNGDNVFPNLSFAPIFNIFQQIYNAATSGVSEDKSIRIKEIKFGHNALNNQSEPVGRVAFREVGKEELKMLPPHNETNGLSFLGIKDEMILENFNAKVIAYSRKPGMVIEYAVDSKWSPNNINLKEDHILLGFFVPNSNAILIPKFREAGYNNLESYLRDIESSDHAEWEDLVDMTLVSRMRNYTSRAIREVYQSEEEDLGTSITSGLSRKFGKILMPPKNYGQSSTNRVRNQKEDERSIDKSRKSDISVIGSRLRNKDNVKVNVKIFLRSKSKFSIYVNVSTIDKNISEKEWLENFNSNYPFEIQDVFINKVNGKDINQNYQLFNNCQEELLFTLPDKKSSLMNLHNKIDSEFIIDCDILLRILSIDYLPSITIRNT